MVSLELGSCLRIKFNKISTKHLKQPPALGHGQLFTLGNRHWAAGLAGQLGTYRVLHLFQEVQPVPTQVVNHIYQFANLVWNTLALRIGLLPKNNHIEIIENIQ